ncbi:hypothetical protein Hanom_Chr12g01103091 [Helianthus anomalus]
MLHWFRLNRWSSSCLVAGVEVVTLMVMQQMENAPGRCLNVIVELAVGEPFFMLIFL